jgi:tetratricopeptide (TPR) repeat protein
MVRGRVMFLIVLSVVVIGMFATGIYLATRPTTTQSMETVKRWTITPLPSATFTETPGPTATGFVPMAIVIDATSTPTALYVATPHNRMEAYSAAMRAYEKGNWDSALTYFNQVLVDEPNSPDIYYHIGDIYRFQGKYKEALTAYGEAIKLDANFAPPYLGKARVYLDQTPSKPEEALASLQLAINKDPQMYEAYLEMTRASLALNDPESALNWLGKYVETTSDNAVSCMYRAQVYLELGDDEKALAEIKKANGMDPGLIAVYKLWGQTLQALNQYSESIPPLLTAANATPLDTEVQALLARAYYEIGDSEKAASIISTLLQQDAKNIDAYLLRGDIALDQNQLDEANTAYNAVLRVDYNNFAANIGLGRVFLAKGLPGAAFNKFDYTEKLARSDAQKATLAYWEAKAYQGLSYPSAAITSFEAALAYPGGVLPIDLREDAEAQLATLYTPTPTSTQTLTPKPSATPTITKTPAATATPTAKATTTP